MRAVRSVSHQPQSSPCCCVVAPAAGLLGASKNAWRRMSAEVRMVKEVKIFVRSGAAFSRPSYHVTARRSLATMLSLLLEPPG